MRPSSLALVLALVSALAACDSPGGGSATPGPSCQNGRVDPGELGVDCGGPCVACSSEPTPTCTDGAMNGRETAVDCGGTCPGCAAGSACTSGSDCLSSVCSDGTCAAPTTCSDAALSPGETDVDCGGACGPCATDKNCGVDGDCLSRICTFGVCRDPSCTDARKNQDETGVDCGGLCPADCADGVACVVAGDCTSGQCSSGTCTSCSDGKKNGSETGTDCGGTCAPCALGVACNQPSECTSGRCEGGLCSSCADGRRSGSESDVDCGGECGECPLGDTCNSDFDCEVDCAAGVCRSCSDGRKNGDETGTDCGGTCSADCADGVSCSVAGDCTSGRCTSGTCTSCDDGKKNGDETGIDCGGSCADACAIGAVCNVTADCAQGICDNNVCCTANACGDACGPVPTEVCNGVDDDCDGGTDEDLAAEPPLCPKQAGVCAGARTSCINGAYSCSDHTYYFLQTGYESPGEGSCDGLDNDCDGLTDENLRNACGSCGTLGNEVCDGQDNDCNGQTDEIAGCAACAATPTLVTLAPKAGTSFGGPPVPGQLLAVSTSNVWSVHSEPTAAGKNNLYVTRYVDGTSAVVSNVLNDRTLSPTLGVVEDALVVAGRADFSPFARRLQRISNTASPASLGFETISSTTPAVTVAQRLFGEDSYSLDYVEVLPNKVSIIDGYDEEPWSASFTMTPGSTTLGVLHEGPYEWLVESRPNGVNPGTYARELVSFQPEDKRLGPVASTIEVGMREGDDLVAFDVDATTGAVRNYFRRSPFELGDLPEWTTGTVPFPSGLRFLGGDIVTRGPIIVLALDASQRLVGLVLQRDATAWTQKVYGPVSGLMDAARTEVAVDPSGRAHLLAEVSGTSRVYLMACPTCPAGGCTGPAGPLVIDELFYDAVGADDDVFIELRGAPGQVLTGMSLVGIGGDTGTAYRTVPLTGAIPASGRFLIVTANANPTLTAMAQLVANVDFQNGPDAVALRDADGVTLDAVAYAAQGASILPVGEGSPALAPAPGQSLARTNGVDTGNNAADFHAATPTPGQ